MRSRVIHDGLWHNCEGEIQTVMSDPVSWLAVTPAGEPLDARGKVVGIRLKEIVFVLEKKERRRVDPAVGSEAQADGTVRSRDLKFENCHRLTDDD